MRKLLFLLYFMFIVEVPAAESFGRLFFTPEQRDQLEIVREKRDRRLPVSGEPEAAAATAPPVLTGPAIVNYSGMVRRSDGKSTVWINGRPVTEKTRTTSDGEISVQSVRRDGSVSVAIPLADRRASLKVGQSLEVDSGVIEEPYQRRATLPRPRQALLPGAPASPAETADKAAANTAKPPQSPEDTRASNALTAAGTFKRQRESDFKEADPDSGATPAVRVPGK